MIKNALLTSSALLIHFQFVFYAIEDERILTPLHAQIIETLLNEFVTIA